MPNSPFSIVITPVASPARTYDFHIEQEGQIVNEGYEFLWSFGDGNTSDSATPMHTYAAAGNYTVTCEVISLEGRDPTDDPGANPPPTPPPEGFTLEVF